MGIWKDDFVLYEESYCPFSGMEVKSCRHDHWPFSNQFQLLICDNSKFDKVEDIDVANYFWPQLVIFLVNSGKYFPLQIVFRTLRNSKGLSSTENFSSVWISLFSTFSFVKQRLRLFLVNYQIRFPYHYLFSSFYKL